MSGEGEALCARRLDTTNFLKKAYTRKQHFLGQIQGESQSWGSKDWSCCFALQSKGLFPRTDVTIFRFAAPSLWMKLRLLSAITVFSTHRKKSPAAGALQGLRSLDRRRLHLLQQTRHPSPPHDASRLPPGDSHVTGNHRRYRTGSFCTRHWTGLGTLPRGQDVQWFPWRKPHCDTRFGLDQGEVQVREEIQTSRRWCVVSWKWRTFETKSVAKIERTVDFVCWVHVSVFVHKKPDWLPAWVVQMLNSTACEWSTHFGPPRRWPKRIAPCKG